MPALFAWTRPRSPSACPRLEALEDRNVPSTITVNIDDGLWRWDSTLGWGHISNWQASETAIDDFGNVFATFSSGLWRWSASTYSWQKLSSLTTATDIGTTGSGVLYADFGANGTWRWSPTAGWLLLSTHNVGDFAVSNSDAFFGEYTTGSPGTWRWTPATGWMLLTSNWASEFGVDDSGQYVGLFKAGTIRAGDEGIWVWNPTLGWARSSTTVPASITVAENGYVYLDQNAAGISLLLPRVGEWKISYSYANFIAATPNGNLVADIQGSPNTGWWYNAAASTWWYTVANTNDIYGVVYGKDSDVFVDWGTYGLWRWTPVTGWVQLSAKDPSDLTGQGSQQIP